jgi:hypothetical protein
LKGGYYPKLELRCSSFYFASQTKTPFSFIQEKGDHARKRSRPSGAFWDQEGAFYGQDG